MDPEIASRSDYRMAEGYEKLVVKGILQHWTPILLKRIPPQPGDHVLDLACGTGVVTRSVLPLVQPGGSVVGQDINKAMLAVASSLLPAQEGRVTWQEGPAENIPFPDQSFDLVLCQQGMQFFANRAAGASEMYRVLRRNGRVGVAAWQGIHTLPLYLKIYNTVNSEVPVPDEEIQSGFNLGNPDELAGLLTAAGFKDVDVAPFSQNASIDDPGLFARMIVMGAAMSSAEFKKLDQPAQAELLKALNQKAALDVNEYIVDALLTFPMYANIARGTRM